MKILLLEICSQVSCGYLDLKTILKNSKCQICGLFFQLFIHKELFLCNLDTF